MRLATCWNFKGCSEHTEKKMNGWKEEKWKDEGQETWSVLCSTSTLQAEKGWLSISVTLFCKRIVIKDTRFIMQELYYTLDKSSLNNAKTDQSINRIISSCKTNDSIYPPSCPLTYDSGMQYNDSTLSIVSWKCYLFRKKPRFELWTFTRLQVTRRGTYSVGSGRPIYPTLLNWQT